VRASFVEDDDASDETGGPEPLVRPILFGKETIGLIALATRDEPDEADRNLVDVIARELGGPIRISVLVEESQLMATIDSLTGLMNRRAFIPALEGELVRIDRYGGRLSVLLVDIDHFKLINDNRGHASGDAVLSAVGRMLRSHMREVDVTGRWGGEEFVVTLPETDAEGARLAAERLRAGFEALVVRDGRGDRINVTASIGVSTYQRGDTAGALVDRADRAMYQAKSNGRNRVSIYPCAPPPDSAAPSEQGAAVDALV
jgi:two-component system cell cycle response regulator